MSSSEFWGDFGFEVVDDHDSCAKQEPTTIIT